LGNYADKSKHMKHRTARKPDITLTLPDTLSTSAQVNALGDAGVPVDKFGQATSGCLFVRTTGSLPKRVHTFRWFSSKSGEDPVVPSTSPRQRPLYERGNTNQHQGPSGIPLKAANAVNYLRVWKELERDARLEQKNLAGKFIAYFHDLGPAPVAADHEVVTRASAIAIASFAAAHDQMDRYFSTATPDCSQTTSHPPAPERSGAPVFNGDTIKLVNSSDSRPVGIKGTVEDKDLIVVNFNPYLIESRDSLLRQLLTVRMN
jgi:hypothetical protein